MRRANRLLPRASRASSLLRLAKLGKSLASIAGYHVAAAVPDRDWHARVQRARLDH